MSRMIAGIRRWIIRSIEGILWIKLWATLSLDSQSNIRVLVGFINRVHVSIVVAWGRVWKHSNVVRLLKLVCGRIRSKCSSLLLCRVVKASKLNVRLKMRHYCSLILGVLPRSIVAVSVTAWSLPFIILQHGNGYTNSNKYSDDYNSNAPRLRRSFGRWRRSFGRWRRSFGRWSHFVVFRQ